MTHQQIELLIIICSAIVFFIRGKYRYDLVALMALLMAAAIGVIPTKEIFLGFSHPATITVAAVLIIGKGLSNVGATELLAQKIAPFCKTTSLHIFILSLTAAIFSTFMNNVGALAILLPVTMLTSKKAGRNPSYILMPVSFSAMLGGLITSIGTPPNIIISKYREKIIGQSFSVFDFTPIGGSIALLGVLFVSFIGWRFLPQNKKKSSNSELTHSIAEYLVEVQIQTTSTLIGKSLYSVRKILNDTDIAVVGILRKKEYYPNPKPSFIFAPEDILIIEGDPSDVSRIIHLFQLNIVDNANNIIEFMKAHDEALVEAIVISGATFIGKRVNAVDFHEKQGVNLLGISRQGETIHSRFKNFNFQEGDVLLLKGSEEDIQRCILRTKLLPIAPRNIPILNTNKILEVMLIFSAGLCLSIFNIFPLSFSLVSVCVLYILLKIIPIHSVYNSIDAPVVVLIACMIPLGHALETTGTAKFLVNEALNSFPDISIHSALVITMIITMFVSDVLNNTATAVLMAPIATELAYTLHSNPDPFLMVVAVAASCAFLTPIGHQNNMIIMGPGGYKFKDYWRMGLPLEILIVLLGVPLILYIWPP